MAVYSKKILNGDTTTSGKGIKVATNSTPGTLVHTAVSGTTDFDELWIYAYNSHSASIKLTLEFGGTSDPDNTIVQPVASQSGLYLVVPGFVVQNGAVIRAFADTVDKLVLYGFVNSISSS